MLTELLRCPPIPRCHQTYTNLTVQLDQVQCFSDIAVVGNDYGAVATTLPSVIQ